MKAPYSDSQGRRRFLRLFAAAGAVAVAAPFAGSLLADNPPAKPAVAGGDVLLDCFDDHKKSLGTCREPKVTMSDADWRKKLGEMSYYVTRQAGTERAYTGPGWDRHENGLYRCIGCDTALFDSATKFESGTGWPSFWQPISKRNVAQREDTSLFMDRTEITCPRCDAHLGHVFDDGPRPTGLRYCMNAVAMRFVAVPA
ncbi:MAG TPA: peptide-methionine (R)-S-oxide reductase MsrB [Luteibacter sp.]|jgi:peptide-methionine (R)-S-oxide reductase|nr:peptide-methionine (R)-S-oxide reductase MsrB [Luteibacter sp.]